MSTFSGYSSIGKIVKHQISFLMIYNMTIFGDVEFLPTESFRHYEFASFLQNAQGLISGTHRFFTPRNLMNTFQQKNSMCTKILGSSKIHHFSPGLKRFL